MGKYFTFVDRFLPIEFFEEDPVKITVQIGDEMDAKIDATFAALKKPMAVAEKLSLLDGLIGADHATSITSRMEAVDGYALDQVLLYLREAYLEGKVKNLQAAKAGRKRK